MVNKNSSVLENRSKVTGPDWSTYLSGTQGNLGVLHLTELCELIQDHHHVICQGRVPATKLILPITTHPVTPPSTARSVLAFLSITNKMYFLSFKSDFSKKTQSLVCVESQKTVFLLTVE